jgi:hypothetical protein
MLLIRAEEKMDQKQRIQELKDEAMKLSGGEMQSFGLDSVPAALAEEFLKRVIAFETAPTATDFDLLTADNVPLPPPDEVSDHDIGVVLWRVIFALARHRTVLESTNHLSDRELYSVLWHDVLREKITVIPAGDTGAYHVNVPGDDEDCTNYLAYYADDDTRQSWSDDPDFVMPPRKYAAHDRDNDLPRADDEPQCAEALEWLRARRNPSSLATNRFGTTEAAVKFVEQLYAEGASCVIVDHIEMLPQDEGEPYADELTVIFPADARRKAIFSVIEHEGRPDTIDGEEEIIDQGGASVRLWWD